MEATIYFNRTPSMKMWKSSTETAGSTDNIIHYFTLFVNIFNSEDYRILIKK